MYTGLTMPILKKTKFSPQPVMVEVITSDIKISYDLLDKENLDRIGISRRDIREVQPIFAIPGYLYEEEGIARKHHRLIGSACAKFYTHDGRRFSVDDLWYFDENVKKTHFDGKPHWNHERRIVNHSEERPTIIHFTKHVEGHAIPTSCYIDITLNLGSVGKLAEKRVFRP
jgi:hypothetical protein